MLETAEFLLPMYKVMLDQLQIFIASRGNYDQLFSITAHDDDHIEHRMVAVRYYISDYPDKDYLSETTVNTRDLRVAFRSGVKIAMHFLEGVFDSRENVDELLAFDASVSPMEAARRLAWGTPCVETDGFRNDQPGTYLTTIDGQSIFYGVEDRGEIYQIADSNTPAMLVYLMHVLRRNSDTNVSERSAKLYRGYLDRR